MTTIGSTAYYTSTTRYGGSETANSSKADDAYAIASQENGDTQSSSGETTATVDIRPSTAIANFQGKLVALNRLDISGLKATPIWEMSEDLYQSVVDTREMMLEAQYRQVPEAADLSDYDGTKPYATVVVGARSWRRSTIRASSEQLTTSWAKSSRNCRTRRAASLVLIWLRTWPTRSLTFWEVGL